MKKISVPTLIFIFLTLLFPVISDAQSNTNGVSPVRNAFTFNLGQYLVNEINLGYEHIFKEKKGLEINGGLIYRNDLILSQAKDWSNSQYFYERGFAARIAYKIYRKSGEKSGRKSFYSFGLNYQYLYFNNEWFETDKEIKYKPEPSAKEIITNEEIYRHRFRNRAGLQITLGNIIPMSNTFALELFYGCGVRGILSDRFDVARGVSVDDNHIILQVLDYGDRKFYIRPSIHAGVKLRMGW